MEQTKDIIKNAIEIRKAKEISDLKKRVSKLEKKHKPKTLIEKEIEKEKNWLYED